jgi:CDP-diacylglycerol---glycerol-3-phosphate 3-phosphatidyltransferase
VTLLPRRPPAVLVDPLVRVLASIGVTPAMLTTAGFLGNVAAAVAIAFGNLFLGGVFVLLFSALDMLDGALARATGKASRFGALYDSTLDRLSEAVVLAGIAWYYLDLGHREEPMLAIVALAGSLMVSYVRARSEGLGQPITDGLFTRSERVVITGVALLFGLVRPALWLLAVLTVLTAFQRLWIASRLLIAADAREVEQVGTRDEEV